MRILFTGGGSGGHITPIVAVARQLRKNYGGELELFFLGAAKFSDVLKEEGIMVRTVMAGKLRRSPNVREILQNILDIFKVPLGLAQCLWHLLYLMPDAIFSKGGYGSVPVVLATWLYRIPVLIHESDTIPGLANRLAARFAKRIAVSFSECAAYFPPQKTAVLGNPIRSELVEKCLNPNENDKEQARQTLQITSQKPVIFIIGGSQGGKRMNEITALALGQLLGKYEIIHQCGEKHYNYLQKTIKPSVREMGYHLVPFLEEKQLTAAYILADLIISRAGGTSIFEIAACHKPSILVPMTGSASGHQRENAFAYARSGAAIVIEQENLTPNLFLKQINNIFESPELRQKFIDGAKSFARLDAAEKIAQVLVEMAK